jgi:hypothetical protein
MKTLLKTALVITILFCSTGIQAQKPQPKLNQLELYKQYLGTWHAKIGADSMEIREYRQYGLSFVIEVYQVIHEQKTPLYINNLTFDANDNKFKGFILYHNGGYFTWIGHFTKTNYFTGNIVFNFMPDVAWSEFHSEIISPTEFRCTNINKQSMLTSEMTFVKVN